MVAQSRATHLDGTGRQMPKTPRSDTARNRHKLVRSAAELVARDGAGVKMNEVAEHAGLSLATAYRHFGSVEKAVEQYRFDVGMKLYAYSVTCEAQGVPLLHAVSQHWVGLVVRHGRAMVSTRSREGYLKRLRAGTPYVSVGADALALPIRSAAAELGIPDPGDEGMFLWNILFDPREIFDLIETLGMSPEAVTDRLVTTYCAALVGWLDGRIPPSPATRQSDDANA